MSFLDHIQRFNQYDLSGFLPFYVDGKQYGWLRPEFAAELNAFPDVFNCLDNRVELAARLTGVDKRTLVVSEVISSLSRQGVINALCHEPYPVTRSFEDSPLFTIDRAAAAYFGIRAFGVHVNGLVDTVDGLAVWVGIRSREKPTFPGMYDHIVAGGQPAGLSLADNVIKESEEEAGIPKALAVKAEPIGEIRYVFEMDCCLKLDTIYTYDLQLPADFQPRNTDGEMESFELWPIEKLAVNVDQDDRFKPNCNLVIIDLLVRKGLIDTAHPDFEQIQVGLSQSLPLI